MSSSAAILSKFVPKLATQKTTTKAFVPDQGDNVWQQACAQIVVGLGDCCNAVKDLSGSQHLHAAIGALFSA